MTRPASMHFDVIGRGRCTLLILPGWRLDSTTEKPDWMPIMTQRPHWRAVFVDLPGTGNSRGRHMGISSQLDILDRVDELVAAERLADDVFAVAGTSNGGALALALALRRRQAVDGFALRAPMLEPDRHLREVSGSAREEELLPSAPVAYRHEHEHKVATLWRPAREDRIDAEFLREIREDPARYGIPETLRPHEELDMPALVVLGRQDARVGWRRDLELTAPLPRATVAVLDRAGHALPAGAAQHRLWAALVDDWLDRVEEFAETTR